ncbi:MAG: hypothetical protein AAF799_15595 [Myxococcota bacterium]
MRAPFVRPLGLALAGLLLAAACGKEAPPPAKMQPVELSAEQKSTVAKFAGKWEHIGGTEESEASLAAVSKVTSEMNGLIRGMAQSRLEESVRIDATMEISEAEGIVTIGRSERPKPFVAPADGKVFETVNDEGDEAKGSLKLDGETIQTRVETDQGGGERTYRIDDEGRLEIVTRIFSPRLPGDVVYTTHYKRP